MKQFQRSDVYNSGSIAMLRVNKEDLISRPLQWQKLGLQQTATGYGNKLTTEYKINFDGRVYRVYAVCHSNVASYYIITMAYGKLYLNM